MTGGDGPEILVGPLLRYVGERDATVWVEADRPCEVELLGHRERTFAVADHHYALVVVEELDLGSEHPYEVRLDGRLRWPPRDFPFPECTIRTLNPDRGLDLCYGSCRVALPHEPPYTLTRDQDERGYESDALVVLAREIARRRKERLPDVIVMLGDQVYVDEGAPQTRAAIRARRDVSRAPGEEVADFEEYARLYREAWATIPELRWLLSTVSTSMIIDDHDISDDWNISRSWVRERRATSWWRERILGGIASYWIYQHLGNLSPRELREQRTLSEARAADGDAAEIVRAYAERADAGSEGVRFSFHRDLGRTRLIVMDSRAGRVLDEGQRSIFDRAEGDWIGRMAEGDFDHLLLATSDPVLMVQGAHFLEAWSERVCDGHWGRAAAAACERLRRALDFDHWPSFMRSFELVAELLRAVGAGEHGRAPASIVLLSGDVHHAYLAEVGFPRRAGVRSAVHQAVCSPFRNPLGRRERAVIRILGSRAAHAFGRALARAAGADDPAIRWRLVQGPYFDNQVGSLRLRGRDGWARLEKTAGEGDETVLQTTYERRIARA